MISAEAMPLLGDMVATWVHNLDPVLFPVWGEIKVRWYGLAYLAGFVVGYFVLKWLAQRKLWVVPPEKVGDFIAYAALFGVFLGGRLGYVLFYMIPERGLGVVLADPLAIVRVWDGGMASHGGILGLTIFTFVYARKCKFSWPAVGDGLVIAAPLGVFFGRAANFINGELYGRVTDVGWAMKFPKELLEPENHERFLEAMQQAVRADPERLGPLWEAYLESPGVMKGPLFEGVMEASRSNEGILDVLANYVETRHPSQIYQALLEGLLLFAILLAMRLRWPRMPHGILTGCFFIFYAFFRIVVERFREPDSAWVIDQWVTKGQFYSFFMFAIGAAFLVCAARGKTGRPDGGSPERRIFTW